MGFITSHKLMLGGRNKYVKRRVLPGVEVGVPMVLFQELFTHMHYGYSITNIDNIVFQFASGFFTYSSDRLLDSFDNLDKPSERDIIFQKNKGIISVSLIITYLLLVNKLSTPYTFGCIPLLTSTIFYKQFKQQYGEYKALFISSMWTLSTVILPCVLYENNWNILYSPIDYIPPALTLFATSNIADVSDMDEDTENNIQTIPVRYGKTTAYIYSMAALAISSFCLAFHPNFETNELYISSLELQNAAISLLSLPQLFNYTNYF